MAARAGEPAESFALGGRRRGSTGPGAIGHCSRRRKHGPAVVVEERHFRRGSGGWRLGRRVDLVGHAYASAWRSGSGALCDDPCFERLVVIADADDRGRRTPDWLRTCGERTAGRLAARLCRRRGDHVAAPAPRAVRRVRRRRVGRAGRGWVNRSARALWPGRVRRLPGRLHPAARTRAPVPDRALVRRHPRARAAAATRRHHGPTDPGIRVCGLGGFTPSRRRRTAPSPRARPGRSLARGVRRHVTAHDVLGLRARRD